MGVCNGKTNKIQKKAILLKQDLYKITNLINCLKNENEQLSNQTSIICAINNEEKLFSQIVTNMNTKTQICDEYCEECLLYQNYQQKMQCYQKQAKDILIKAIQNLEQFNDYSSTVLYITLKKKVETFYQFAFELQFIDLKELPIKPNLEELGTLCQSIVMS